VGLVMVRPRPEVVEVAAFIRTAAANPSRSTLQSPAITGPRLQPSTGRDSAGWGAWAGRVGWARGLGAWAGRVGWARGLGAWAGVVIMTTNCIVGSWLENFPLLPNGKVEEGLVVWSRSGTIEGRTTGYRCPCYVPAYEGRFICVNCETGQPMKICSECWECDSPTCEVHLAKGGEISSRFTCGATKDRPPLPREEWPDRRELRACKGWRIRSAS
jgi:hypothetical protein